MTEQRITSALGLVRQPGLILQYIGSASSQLIVLAAQLITFALLARHLGETQFGKLMTITATTQIAVSLCGVGSEEPMIRRLVRDRSCYPSLLGHCLLLITSSGLVLGAISVLILYASMQPPMFTTLVIFAVSNILLFRYIYLTEAIFIGRLEYMRANKLVVTFAIARLVIASIATLLFKVDNLQTWAFWHGATYVVTVLGCAALLRPLGAPRWTTMPDEVRRGIHVAIPFFLGNLRGNVDVLVLSFAVGPSTVGNYGAASRIVQASQVTLWAFNRIMYPKLVAGAAGGHQTLLELAFQQAFVMTAIGGVTSIGLYIISPYAAAAFGEGFVSMAGYLRILCWIVLLVGIQSVAFDALAALERHALRASIANICSVVGVGLVAALTFSFGIAGTFVAIFVTLTVSLASMWLALLHVTNGLPFKL